MSHAFSVVAQDEFDAPPQHVWGLLRELRGIATPSAIAEPARSDQAGEVLQTVRWSPDVWFTQRLVERDDAARTMRLELVEAQGLDLASYSITIEVLPAGSPDRCTVRFTGEGKAIQNAAHAENLTRGMYALGLESLAAALRSQDPAP
ncbi:MAG: SRPBCC family protein [Phycisphaerales bacterium]|jgi:hypothetical protein|nr:SRPBCC family protein [Phycisphaerales bacterium]